MRLGPLLVGYTGVMARRKRVVHASPDRVFDTLLKAENFAYWVVGSKRVRGVDPDWPQVGSSFHHAVGFGPLQIEDHTKILDIERPRRLVMSARMGWGGSATVSLLLQPLGRRRTRVVMDEEAESGPVAWLPRRLLDRAVGPRNRHSLRRLARLVERPESVPARRRRIEPD